MVTCRKGFQSLAKKLIEKGVDLEALNNEGHSPLMVACLNNDIKLVSLLLQSGANPNAKNILGETAIHIAQNNHNDSMEQLIMKYKSKSGMNPINPMSSRRKSNK